MLGFHDFVAEGCPRLFSPQPRKLPGTKSSRRPMGWVLVWGYWLLDEELLIQDPIIGIYSKSYGFLTQVGKEWVQG